MDIYALALQSGWAFFCVFALGAVTAFSGTRISREKEDLRGFVCWAGVGLGLFSPYLLSYVDGLVWYVPAFWRLLGLFSLGVLLTIGLMVVSEDSSADNFVGFMGIATVLCLIAAGCQLEAVVEAIADAYSHGEVLAAVLMSVPTGLFLLPLAAAAVSAALGVVAAVFALFGFV